MLRNLAASKPIARNFAILVAMVFSCDKAIVRIFALFIAAIRGLAQLRRFSSSSYSLLIDAKM